MKNVLSLIFSTKQLIIGIQVTIYLLLFASFGAYSQSTIKGTVTATGATVLAFSILTT